MNAHRATLCVGLQAGRQIQVAQVGESGIGGLAAQDHAQHASRNSGGGRWN
jgi:hypothetical protein